MGSIQRLKLKFLIRYKEIIKNYGYWIIRMILTDFTKYAKSFNQENIAFVSNYIICMRQNIEIKRY